MLVILDIPYTAPWIMASLILYGFAGACWIPVVWLQIRMQKLSEQANLTGGVLPEQYWRYARYWFWLGVPAFISMVLIVLLMVYKFA